MTVRPGSWHHPEDATHEELIEMVTKLMVRNKRMKKRAGESNRRADAAEQKLWRFRSGLRSAQLYYGLFVQQRNEGWLHRLSHELNRMKDL